MAESGGAKVVDGATRIVCYLAPGRSPQPLQSGATIKRDSEMEVEVLYEPSFPGAPRFAPQLNATGSDTKGTKRTLTHAIYR